MSNSIYALLNFPSNDPILGPNTMEMAPDVMMQMNLAPNLVNSWQQTDIANNDTAGYFMNPTVFGMSTANTASKLYMSLPSITTYTTNGVNTLMDGIWNTANSIVNFIPSFTYHTNRMSNVVGMGSDVTNPHYELATGYGKVLTFITNKTDGIQNNSVMLGCFGSILAANALSSNANTFLEFTNLYSNTINANTYIDGTGNTVTEYDSNISLANAQTLWDSANNIYYIMTHYKQQDTTFFTNTKNVMDSYSKVSGFSRLGQTETDLIMNHIGTDKIKTRLSS